MVKQEIPNGSYIVLVTGSRQWTNIDAIRRELGHLPKNSIVVHGACRGVDSFADMVSDELGIGTISCPAHWKHSGELWTIVYGPCQPDCKEVVGKAAGPIRNCFMLDAYSPNIVLAFHDNIIKSRGTRHMVGYALKKNFEVKIIEK
jgi:hypothetical protein